NPAARIYAVCDTQKEVALARQKEWDAVRTYTDYREMLQDRELDAVEILTPQTLHEPMVMDAARAGIHIALQKPMTINLPSADRMLAAVEQAGVLFKVTDNYLFYPPIVAAKKIIDAGEIGTPTNLRMKLISGGSGGWDVPPEAWQWRLAEKEAGRGMQTFDHGHHLWATAWFLMGGIERVTAWIDSIDGIIDSPAVIMWKYKDGIQYGQCEYAHAAGMTIPSKYYANDEWIEITGSHGIILINRCTGNLQEGPSLSVFKDDKWRHYPDIEADWGQGFVGATHNFVAAIRDDARLLLTGLEGREILKISLAIARSAQLRREVYVDELDTVFPYLYTRKRIRGDKKKAGQGKGLLERFGLGGNDSRYAGRALELTEAFTDRFDQAAAGEWEADIGLLLSADGGIPDTRFSVAIRSGQVVIEKGRLPENAQLTLTLPAGTWAAILLGKKRIETALIQRKLKLEGKAELGLKLRSAFRI
ncbi:MAG: Gfo/Idh/MocA family oxidoreductase, partial [Desulfobacterales bacterium]|nr:Gfo/Idh/MocA family oxidoreductase [Desulfobacterales bacterium]